ncbi:hypothetical protein ES703_86576 [subsurface metagenome]
MRKMSKVFFAYKSKIWGAESAQELVPGVFPVDCLKQANDRSYGRSRLKCVARREAKLDAVFFKYPGSIEAIISHGRKSNEDLIKRNFRMDTFQVLYLSCDAFQFFLPCFVGEAFYLGTIFFEGFFDNFVIFHSF